jgi:hypothetical protein
MSTEKRNKAVVAKYFDEYWVKGNVSIVDELCSDDFLISYPNHGPRRGKAEAKRMLSEFREVCANHPARFGTNTILQNANLSNQLGVSRLDI